MRRMEEWCNRIDGNFISINYFVDESIVPSAPPPLPLPRPTTTTNTTDTQMIDTDDVKPTLETVRDEDGEEDMEIDQLDSATPEAPGRHEKEVVVRFPLQMLENSRADSIETYQAVTGFVNE